MKVFFGCTTANFKDYKDNYFNIRNHLIKIGCKIQFDWLDDADRKIKQNKGGKRNIKYVYKQVVEAIATSDAVVIEYSVPNFSSSHQINFALMRRKPTLVLRLEKDNSYFSDSYIEAVESSFLTVKDYSQDGYKEILEKFIGISKIGNKPGRYNVVLGQNEKYYLDWASNQYGKSRSAIIREGVQGLINKDEKFNRFITGKIG